MATRTIGFSLRKKQVEEIKEEAKQKLTPEYNNFIQEKFVIDVDKSKKDLMKLKKDQLCDIIISAFIIEQQGNVKYWLATRIKNAEKGEFYSAI